MYKIVTDTEVSEEIKSSLAEASSVFIPIVQLARAEIPSLTLGLYFPEAGEFTVEGFEFTDIDWGDGQVTGYDGDKQYTYAYAAGTRIAVKIYGIAELPESIFAENQNICSIATYLDIPAGAFSGCINLFDVNLAEGCAVIDDEAFFDTAVKYIKVPRTVVYLGNCVNMSSTVIELTQPDPYKISISDELFKYSVDTCTLIVPYGSFEAYVTAHPVKYDVPDTPQTFGLERPETAVTMAMERRAIDYPYDADLVFVVEVSDGTTIYMPKKESTGSSYTVSWGDGTTNTSSYSLSHTYDTAGRYEIKIYIDDISQGLPKYFFYYAGSDSDEDSRYSAKYVHEIYSSIENLTCISHQDFSNLEKVVLVGTKSLSDFKIHNGYNPTAGYSGGPVEFIAPDLESMRYVSDYSSSYGSNVDGIRNLYAPNLRTIYSCMFGYVTELDFLYAEEIQYFTCPRLVSLNLPSIQKLGNRALSYCESLVELNLGNNLQSIGDEAFRYCRALQNVVIPSAEVIGAGIFEGCEKLVSVILPENLKTVSGTSLAVRIAEITIPASVETIIEPFSLGKQIAYMNPLNPPVLQTLPDGGTLTGGTIYVKPAAYDRYKNHTDWKNYTILSKAEILETPVVQISKSGIVQWVCANAVSYKYLLDGTEYETTETAVQLTAGQVIQVKGIGDGTYFVDSEYSAPQAYEPNKIVAEKLEPPALQISRTGMARWLQINATGYEYSIDEGVPVTTIATSIQLSENQSIRVRALGDGLYFATSDYSETKVYDVEEFEPAVLPVPIVQVSKTGLATWMCANAASYIYEIDGVETETRGTAVQLMPGQSIRVKALGDDTNYWDSEYSNIYSYELTLVKLETPIVQISKSGVAQWVCVNASGYYCDIDGIITFTLASSIQLNPGSVVRIKGAGDGLNYSDSDYSEPVEYVFYPESTVRTPFDRFAFRSEVIDVLNKIPNAENMEKLQTQVEVLGNAVNSNAESIAAVPAMIPKKVSSLENDAQYVQKSDAIFSTLIQDISKNTQAVGTKLDWTVSANILYGTNAVGVQVHYPISIENIGSTVAQRDTLGELRVADATNPASAINLRQFVETLTELKGTPNGFAMLNDMGLIPASQLPSYVDDVIELRFAAFPSTGESGKIYIDTDTNKQYRWSGTQYAEISSSLALGEVVGTAYPGDKGKANADSISTLWTQVNAITADYIKSTNIAAPSAPGLVAYNSAYGMQLIDNALAPIADSVYITNRSNAFVSYAMLDDVVKAGLVNSKTTWSETDKTTACNLIGALPDLQPSLAFIQYVTTVAKDTAGGKTHALRPLYDFVLQTDRDSFVAGGLTQNTRVLTAAEQSAACNWLGAFPKPADPASMSTHVLAYNPTLKLTTWQLIAENYGGTPNSVVIYASNATDMSMMATNPTTIYVDTPRGKKQAANKDYIDKLPDKITFTDDEKAKWRGMMGATKWYYHQVYLIDGWGDEDAFIEFISTSPDVESFYSPKSIICQVEYYYKGRIYLPLCTSDDRCYIYVVPRDSQGLFEPLSINAENGIRSVLVEEL